MTVAPWHIRITLKAPEIFGFEATAPLMLTLSVPVRDPSPRNVICPPKARGPQPIRTRALQAVNTLGFGGRAGRRTLCLGGSQLGGAAVRLNHVDLLATRDNGHAEILFRVARCLNGHGASTVALDGVCAQHLEKIA
jgi:hypothetical protein